MVVIIQSLQETNLLVFAEKNRRLDADSFLDFTKLCSYEFALYLNDDDYDNNVA